MRITAFRALMAEEFGRVRSEMIARDHVFSELDGMIVDQALEAGVPTRTLWRVVCEAFDVPVERR